jgi:hypothetical protein
MFALQNSLQNETDIVPMLEEWNLSLQNGELFVDNPPVVEFDENALEEVEDPLDEETAAELEKVLVQMSDHDSAGDD